MNTPDYYSLGFMNNVNTRRDDGDTLVYLMRYACHLPIPGGIARHLPGDKELIEGYSLPEDVLDAIQFWISCPTIDAMAKRYALVDALIVAINELPYHPDDEYVVPDYQGSTSSICDVLSTRLDSDDNLAVRQGIRSLSIDDIYDNLSFLCTEDLRVICGRLDSVDDYESIVEDIISRADMYLFDIAYLFPRTAVALIIRAIRFMAANEDEEESEGDE